MYSWVLVDGLSMKGFLGGSGVEGSIEMFLDVLASAPIVHNVCTNILHIKTTTTKIMTIIMTVSNEIAILRDISMEAKGYLIFCNISERLN